MDIFPHENAVRFVLMPIVYLIIYHFYYESMLKANVTYSLTEKSIASMLMIIKHTSEGIIPTAAQRYIKVQLGDKAVELSK